MWTEREWLNQKSSNSFDSGGDESFSPSISQIFDISLQSQDSFGYPNALGFRPFLKICAFQEKGSFKGHYSNWFWNLKSKSADNEKKRIKWDQPINIW
jgi:hypothetical protein